MLFAVNLAIFSTMTTFSVSLSKTWSWLSIVPNLPFNINIPPFLCVSHCALNMGIVSINHDHIMIWTWGRMSGYGY